MSSEKSETMNKYYLNRLNNNSEKSKETDIILLNSEIIELEKIFRDQIGSGMFTSKNEFVKLSIFLEQLHAGNNSKKLKNDINQLLKTLYK